jgi:transcriptional regulator
MYLPPHFSESNNKELVRNLVIKNSFVTILSFPEDSPVFINHLPVIFSSTDGDSDILIGHMARKNPQWSHFKNNPQGTIIVNGPSSYISPNWYKSGRDVPTWNYAVAHLYGELQLIESFDEQIDILKQLTGFFENQNTKPWDFDLPADLSNKEDLTAAIISFKFRINKIEAKFKLSQNRSAEDRQGVIAGLNLRSDDNSQLIKELMQENE